MSAFVLVGLHGGEPFDSPAPLAGAAPLVFLLDASSDAPDAFSRRQRDVRNALDGNGRIVFLLGPGIGEGLATQFGCWIRAKIGLDIIPWAEPREVEPTTVDGGYGNAEIRFFSGGLPEGATALARGPSGELAAVRFPAGSAEVVLAPTTSASATNVETQLDLLR